MEKKCKFCGSVDNLRIDKIGRIYSICNICYPIEKSKETSNRWINTTNEEKKRIKDKRETTNMLRFGVEHAAQNKEVQDKMKITCLERFGVENVYKSPEIIEKIQNTKLEKYDDIYYNNLNKSQETSLEKYGVKSSSSVDFIKNKISISHLSRTKEDIDSSTEKRRGTCKEKYGEYHVMHVEEFFNRCQKNNKNIRHKWYPIKLPSGKEISVQGYERYIIKFLIDVYGEVNLGLKKSEVPKIDYIDFDGNNRKYFPDFFIKTTNTIVEVKSFYTYTKEIIQNMFKQQAVVDAGYGYMLVVL